MLIFILFDEYVDNFHKRSEGVRFVFANFIDQPVEQGNQSVVFSFSVGTNTVSASEDHAFTGLLTSRFCMDHSFQRPRRIR